MLEDLFKENLDLVICGTAAGNRSAQLKQYYAGHGNKFWQILAQVGLTPYKLLPSQYRLLLSYGIGLTDIVKGQSGSDAAIYFHDSGRYVLREKILRFKPRYFCFNGKRAAKEFYNQKRITFGPQSESIGGTKFFVAPSTSGAANATWDPNLWHKLSILVKTAV